MYKSNETWKNMNSWSNVLPPSRPGTWQLYEITKLCENRKIRNAAVLGSTIEYRDLLAEIGVDRVFVFESNLSYHCSVSINRRFNSQEIIVHGDWMDTIQKYKDFFDLILSDLTSGNLPYNVRTKFYRDISESLTREGLFIDRLLTKQKRYLESSKLLKKYERKEITLRSVNDFNCEMIFCSDLLQNSNGVLDTSKIYDRLLKLENKKIIDFVNACYAITPRDCIWWYSIEWDKEQIVINKYLEIQDCYDEPEESPYFDRVKLFVFKRK